jgi:hypothetical protein
MLRVTLRPTSRITALLILALNLLPAFAQTSGDERSDWPAEISTSLFESLTDIGFSADIGFLTLKGNIERKVFDNHDILDSWTVADFFSLPLVIPLDMTETLPIGPIVIRGRLRSTLSFDTLNLRQVLPKNMNDIPTLEEINAALEDPSSLTDSQFFKIYGYNRGDKANIPAGQDEIVCLDKNAYPIDFDESVGDSGLDLDENNLLQKRAN